VLVVSASIATESDSNADEIGQRGRGERATGISFALHDEMRTFAQTSLQEARRLPVPSQATSAECTSDGALTGILRARALTRCGSCHLQCNSMGITSAVPIGAGPHVGAHPAWSFGAVVR